MRSVAHSALRNDNMNWISPFLRRAMAYARLRRDAAILAKCDLFDATWYCAANADLGKIRYPALHYLRRGAAEGRNPGPAFDGDAFRARYPDVDMSDANPLLHYFRIGRHEHRSISPPVMKTLPRLSLSDANYQRWIAAYESQNNDGVFTLPRQPVFLVTTPDATDGLRRSLEAQSYPHWRLSITGTNNDTTLLEDKDWDFLLRLPPGSQLTETALFQLAEAGSTGATILHADWDFLDGTGQRVAPQFQTAWEPDLDQTAPLIFVTSRAALHQPITINHIPRVLFHIPGQPPVTPRAPKRLDITEHPLVSVIIPTRDNPRMLARCVNGILKQTDYPKLEIIVVDNASRTRRARRLLATMQQDPRLRVIDFSARFNWSAMNNKAARTARGDILLLLNDDIAVLQSGWLQEMVALAMRPGIGIVGAKLLYPNGGIQHAGISLGAGAVARHLFRHARAEDPGYVGILSQRRSVAAVTGACLAIRRTQFHVVGGLEEAHLGVTNGDIDLCLRIRAQGQRVVWTPFAVLQHQEAATRGLDITDTQRTRLRAEREYLVQTWGALAQSDPYLNPNLDLVGERLALASPPRHAAARGGAGAARGGLTLHVVR